MSDPKPGSKRRLAAVLAADVVSYARLIATDEAATLERLRTLFREAVQPIVAVNGGRLFRLLGDAVLAEFPSAVDAARAALALQEAIRARARPNQPAISLRIGLELGDVVAEGGDLYGHCVNVAARLEALAEPGGIVVSSAVHAQLSGRLACELQPMGPQALKNIPQPIQAFRLRPGGSLAAPEALPPFGPASLAVLPFANLSGDPGQDYLADGLTEELTTALARVRWFHVIARNSAFAYKGRAMDVRQVGQELGVRYVLEGSVRRAGGRLRVTGQLVDAMTGRHLWGDRFEGGVEDVFALQDAVAEAVAGIVEPRLERAEIERVRTNPTASLDAYDLYLRALPPYFTMTEQGCADALVLLRRAAVLDPNYALAKAHAAVCLTRRVAQGWGGSDDREEGARLARDVLNANGNDPLALACIVHALGLLAFDVAGALAVARRALALNPNSAWVQGAAGWANNWADHPNVAMEHFRRAIRLNPHDVDMAFSTAGLGYSYLMVGRPEDALSCGEQALQEIPAMVPGHRVVIAALDALGRRKEARAAAMRFLQFTPNATAAASFRQLYQNRGFAENLIRACREAGLPD